MALATDEAVILAVSDYSETSQIVTALARNHGKVRLLAKGSKRPKNAFRGRIDKLQQVQLVFSVRHRGGLGQLAELTQRSAYSGLRCNLPAFYAASYAAELVVLSTEVLDPHPELFDLLCGLLTDLSNRGDSDILLFRFEVRLLGILGLMPRLGMCVVCGRERQAASREDAEPTRRPWSALFSPVAGGVVCRRCRPEAGEGVAVGQKALDALMFLTRADGEDVGRVRLAAETATDMRKLLAAYWPTVLGRRPRAAKWVG